MSTTMPDLPAYPIPLDGQPHVVALPAAYIAHGLIVVNGGAVALSVTSSRGQSWTVAPGGRLEAPLPEAVPIYTLQSAAVDTSGSTASATFVQELIAVESNTGIATTTLPDVLLVPRTDASALTTATASVALTSGIQSVTIVCQMTLYNLVAGTSRLVGDQSGIIYWEAPTNPSSIVLNSFSVPVYTGLDSSATLTLNWAAAQAGTIYMVVGHSYEAGASINPSGSLSVGLTAGEVPLPVTISGGGPTLTVSPAYAKQPAQETVGSLVAPAASQAIASLTVAALGTYYIEYSGWTYDGAAKTGVNLKINGAYFDGCAQAPAQVRGGLYRVCNAGTVISLNASDFQGGSATYPYFGCIRIYSV